MVLPQAIRHPRSFLMSLNVAQLAGVLQTVFTPDAVAVVASIGVTAGAGRQLSTLPTRGAAGHAEAAMRIPVARCCLSPGLDGLVRELVLVERRVETDVAEVIRADQLTFLATQDGAD